jgi:CRP-like cAMP-binding protein
MYDAQASAKEISRREFVQKLEALLASNVTDLDRAGKQRLLTETLARLNASTPVFSSEHKPLPRLEIVPFILGRRPIDEALQPGHGCGEQVGVLSSAPDVLALDDEIWLLYQLNHIDSLPEPFTPEDLKVHMSLSFVPPMPEMGDMIPVPGMSRVTVPAQVIAKGAYPQPALEAASFANACGTRFVARIVPGQQLLPQRDGSTGWTWESVAGGLRQRTPDGADPYTFAHLFHQRVCVELALSARQELLSKAAIDVDVYDAGRVGSLYVRLIERLVKPDTQAQAERHGVANWHHGYHPWFPVLTIGIDKASLYMRAILHDLTQQWDDLPDPHWLLRVGIYLEFLTCVGIFMAVKADYPDVLSDAEWHTLEHSPLFAEIRDRINVPAWQNVWQLRWITPPSADLLVAGPVSFVNLLNKQKATRAFLHAHHDDLKHAIELAGPNLYHAQEIWHRIFRDAERAVLRNSLHAFPELGHLDQRYRDFILWHQKGQLRLLGVNIIPERMSSLFGDQDGIFPTACRQYRHSMNEVAQWAYARGLMDFTGDECIPSSASLLEAYLANHKDLLATLQKKDGYGPTLELSEGLPHALDPSRDDTLAALRQVAVLRPLLDDEILELARWVRPRRYGPLDRVVIQGQPGDSLFVVASGMLEVLVRQPDGHDLPIGNCEPGSVFGEMGLLAGGERSATVRVVNEAVLYEIHKEHLQPIIQARPQLVADLSALVAHRQSSITRESRQYQSRQEQAESLAKRMRTFLLGSAAAPKKGATLPAPAHHPVDGHEKWDHVDTLLGQIPLFEPLTADEIRALAQNLRLVQCHAGDRIIEQGQPGSSLFVVASGTLEVLARQQGGHDLLINRLWTGSVFGEFALLMGAERTATVRALTDGCLYEIAKDQIQPILAARPQLITDLSVLMANRQAETAEKTQQQTATEQRAENFSRRIRTFVLGASPQD